MFSSWKGHFFLTGDALDTSSISGNPETFNKLFLDITEKSSIRTKLHEKASNLGTLEFYEPHQMKEYSALLDAL